MTILCITGAPIPAIYQMVDLLQQGGMVDAIGLDRQPALTLQGWHEHVLARTDGEQADNPGRLWDRLAAELFLANIDTPLWGWGDHRSAKLLNYWSAFEPALRFVLLCETPRQAIARSIVEPDGGNNLEAVLSDWLATHQALLRFHLRNTQRSVLLWAQDTTQEPATALQLISKKWALTLKMVEASDASTVEPVTGYALAEYLAAEAVAHFPEVGSLQQELEACIPCLISDAEVAEKVISSEQGFQGLIQSFRSLVIERQALSTLRTKAQELHEQLSDAQQRASCLEELEQQLALTVAATDQMQDGISKLKSEKTELAHQNTNLMAALDTEMLTLTQVREELCSAISEANFLSLQLTHARNEAEGLKVARLEIEVRCSTLEKECGLEKDTRARLEASLFETRQEASVLLGQLHETQEQLESYFTQLTDAEKILASLTQNHDHERKTREELQAQRDALLTQQQTLTGACDALAQEKRQLASYLEAETRAKLEVVTQRDLLSEEKKTLMAARDALTQENIRLQELILGETRANAHLHAEKSSLAAERRSLISARESLETEKRQLAALLQTEVQEKNNALAQVETLSQEKQQFSTWLGHEKKSKEEILGQCNLLSTEVDSLKAECRKLQSNNEQLDKSLEAKVTSNGEAAAQHDQLAREKVKLASELQNVRDESKQFLVQLQQAQEELEVQHQKQQTLEEQIKAAASRWQRMLERNPAYCDFDSIQIVTEPTKQSPKTVWKVVNLETAGRRFDRLEFFTVMAQGVAGIGLERKPNTATPLLRWPVAAEKIGYVLALPVGDVEILKGQFSLISELSTSDWDLLQSLSKVLLARPGNISDSLAKSLHKHRQLLERMPAALRFDTVKLLRQQTNPDYEHLWLRLTNLSFGNERWASFEFRLACAKADGRPFGQQPKLEFPVAARSVLHSWYEESDDDFGSKLELRFSLPNNVDTQVWSRLSKLDGQLIIALLSNLPNILTLLQGANALTHRPVEEWQTMSVHMLRALKRLLLPAPPAKPAAAAPAPAPAPTPAESKGQADAIDLTAGQLRASESAKESPKPVRSSITPSRKKPAANRKSASKVELT